MKTKLLTLAMISAFALSACGGGDDSPKVNQSTKPSNQQGQNQQGQNQQGQNQQGQNQQGQNQQGQNQQGQNQQGQNQQGQNQQGQNQQGQNQQGQNQQGQNQQGQNQQGQNQQGQQTSDKPFTMEQQVATFKQTIKNGEPVSMTNTPTYSTSNGDGDNFKKITVNGYTFTMLDTSGDAALDEVKTIVGQENNYGEYYVIPNINNRGTAYAKYGFTIDYKTGNFNLFYQGKPTPVAEVPTTGKATYQGYAFALDPVEYNKHITQEGDYGEWKGLSEFTADFDKKTLTGTLRGWRSLSQTQPKAVQINAKIQANTFKGTANGTGTAEGKFYGTKAQNLAGAFNDKSQNLQGVFGANKQ
ncbi:MAG: transferrin-binding protein-like solute binding protein [Neisseriaceae bacterium]|nr:transferrin-binding protein-like solute binding protein [Neisseriaceae bacterium]